MVLGFRASALSRSLLRSVTEKWLSQVESVDIARRQVVNLSSFWSKTSFISILEDPLSKDVSSGGSMVGIGIARGDWSSMFIEVRIPGLSAVKYL